MKMAKASKQDIDMAIELNQALEQLVGSFRPRVPQEIAQCDEDDEEYFEGNAEQCDRVFDYLGSLFRRASLMRVVFGMSVVVDPDNALIDPDDDCLAHHPDRLLLERAQTLKTADEWHEDHGPALWWTLPIAEPPYVGSPLDTDWPGHHTHWTPIIEPTLPTEKEAP